MILSGPEYLDYGALNGLILKIMPPKQYRTARDHISLASVRATWEVGLTLYRTDFPVQPEAQVACWYGEKEGHMEKAIQKLRQAYPKLTVRRFPGFGHGDIINHPALLAQGITEFLG